MYTENDSFKNELTERTREIWQSHFGYALSRDGAGQIIANIAGFFSILAEWSQAEHPIPANENCGEVSSCNGAERLRALRTLLDATEGSDPAGIWLSHKINGLGRPTSQYPRIDSTGEFSPLSNPVPPGSGH